ncbi:hypothetical protein OK074_5811 [Actinobacteria bacterium OK074]|nr:hypothetical protein OK074_5811 [Actinobacteria bacterium OK074]
MSSTSESYVHEARGPVHSGEGNQYIYIQAAEARLRKLASRRPRSIMEEDREHLAGRFVPPPGLRRARDRLRTSHTVLIDGVPGSGRRTAALMLLHELSALPTARGTLHELPNTSDDTTAAPLDPGDVNEGSLLLLDLSKIDAAQYVAAQGAFSDFRERLLHHGAHFAVVLPHHLGHLLRDELKRFKAEIRQPWAQRLLAAHLRHDGIMPSATELGGTELIAYLTQAPMSEVAGLADRIRCCRDMSPPDRGFPHWLAESLENQHNQSTRVAADIAASRSGRQRALLLSLAMFHGVTPGIVLQARDALLRILSHPPDDTPRLDRADLHAELSAIGAETRGDGRVRFGVPGYERAVRNHFWTYLPDIRTSLRTWFRDCLADPGLGPADRKEAVERFAEQSLRAGRPEDLTWLAEAWTSKKAPAGLLADAAQALALGLDDEQYGRHFRQQIYDWSTSAEPGRGLRQVLIVVCSQTMARSHPDQALVRLHHLARRSPGPVGTDARRALRHLVDGDHRLYRRFLDRLGTGIGQGSWQVDRALFLELADPTRLIGLRAVRDALRTCWAGVLRAPAEDWATDLDRWLTASEDVRHRDLILRVLAGACSADVLTSGRLYRVALRWQRAGRGPEHADVLALLLRELNANQGIEPYGHTDQAH